MLRFVERLAMLLTDSGLARMPARVFAYVLTSDAETHTAVELARGLRVSPAAISGAVRLLVDLHLLVRDREPGDRVDHYRLEGDDVWATLVERRLPIFDRYDQVFAEGQKLLPTDRRGTRRIRETQDYYRFFAAELRSLHERWLSRHAEPSPAVKSAPPPAGAEPRE
ncbi:MarR family transcriptional regulator [Jiangella asiatica]|uniref:MarR family transcriptional regulator n=1 Tax=Jiangella asiatica TaxID=2530372 RepID=A0A4R5CKW2_9ACTN|nr:MarR family transcriptional regulator [Jiangella asiatica]